jgi:hypothetical protein
VIILFMDRCFKNSWLSRCAPTKNISKFWEPWMIRN